MKPTPAQERVLRELILPGGARPPPPEFVEGLRARLAEVAGSVGLARSLWLSKARLAEMAACEGLFAAALGAEGPPFEHSVDSAAGTLAHRSVYLDVASERAADVRAVVERAGVRLAEMDREFARYWRRLDELDRAEHMAAAAARLTMFREAFPPLARARGSRWGSRC